MKSGDEFLFEGPWDKFYVNEDKRCIGTVAVMAERVMFWDKFPSVGLILDNGGYYVYGEGNHTSLAHYIMGAPLRCNFIMETDRTFSKSKNYFPISDASFSDFGPDSADYYHRFRNAFAYLSVDVAKKFFFENGLDKTYSLS
ncbi:hypothetical protein HN680_00985 [Candidatus Peregrinibacteria bacterium]|jgi:hypothetical protein|nr:hypothetical protein [Candidatus Peregrinibacteria bacterium]